MMRARRLWFALLGLGIFVAVGLPSLTARGATIPTLRHMPTPHAHGMGAGIAQDDQQLFLPVTNYDKEPGIPTGTSTATVTPTVTITPTVTPTVTVTATVTPIDIPTAEATGTPIVADLFVDNSNTTATQDGTAQHPYRTLQAAIDVVEGAAMTIAVASGVYTENIIVQEKTVYLYGGFAGGDAEDYANGDAGDFTTRDPATLVSHLRGDMTDSVFTLIEANTSRVDSFRITNGTRTKLDEWAARGGGFYVLGGAPTIAHNLIENNASRPSGVFEPPAFGGGIYADAADISILNNNIRDNTSGRGAGIAIADGTVIIRGNTVQNNRGLGDDGDHGGGLYIFSPDARITHNLITGNEIGETTTYGWGGGIIVYGLGTHALLAYNTVTDNFAPSLGSGVFIDEAARATLDHELYYANRCTSEALPDNQMQGGVALYVDADYNGIGSHITVNHTTIANHPCETAQGGNAFYIEVTSTATIENSIFWDNGGNDIIVDATSKITVSYSLVEEGVDGEGNLSVDPRFADPANHDYHLQSTAGRWDPAANDGAGGFVEDDQDSPAIDAANPAAPFAAEPTPNGGRANMGVYGNTAQASKSAP